MPRAGGLGHPDGGHYGPGVGNYILRHRMLKQGVAWFDQIQKTPVRVNV